MRNWLAVGLVFGVVGSVVGGCSTSSGPATVTDYCQQLAQAECPQVATVCATLNEGTCESKVESQCATAAAAAQEGGARIFTPDNVATCIAAMNGAFNVSPSGSQFVTWQTLNGGGGSAAPTGGSPNDACNLVFAGQLPADQSCRTSYDCAGGNVCGSNGTCGPQTTQSEGAGCADPGDVCANGTVCALSQSGKQLFLCSAGAQVGESCTDDNPCATSAECKGGKCVALSKEGETCKSNADCDQTVQANGEVFGFCDLSLAGTTSGPICTAGYSFGTEAPDCAGFSGTGLDTGS